ncbi:hypothetical protein MnTg04_00366 [bacterium MnTg04]|nr:hypothetical protein MnTg04_00366 [bacterium MnTg04]
MDFMDSDHAIGFGVDIVHVLDAGADIFGRDIAPAEGADEAAKGAEQLLALVFLRVAYQHRLAAAKVEAGYRRLVSHASGKTQDIPERFLFGFIVVHAKSAERRTQRGVMNSDDGFQSTVLAMKKHDLFVFSLIHGFEQFHLYLLTHVFGLDGKGVV